MTAEESANAIQKIGRYRVTGELGRGGMGIVYRGEDRLIGRRVAIKTLTEVTPELRERFYIEARSGILSHQNIVTVYEVAEHEGSPFIAMEYIEGDSLEKVLRLRKRLPLLEALSIVEQVCSGLGYAHGHGVVHRDVKPANILVRPDGRVTIVDFGIARLADQTQKLTKTDALLGTFHYISPERLKGEPSDGRADIWSVGVMLYEMLTGELPFKGSDISSLYRVIHEPYVPLTTHVQDLPSGMSRVLDKALAKQVEVRYATAEEMAFDLQALGEGLKQDRVSALLETARRLTDGSEYASARTALLQAQRIDPFDTETKTLLGNVQDHLSHMQRGEQLRQIIEQAQDAANGRRWNDAVELFGQARKLDTENAFNLDEQLQHAQKERGRQQRILVLWKQADDARNLGDMTKAQDYLGQALEIDDRSTELRNAYSDVLREVQRKRQQLPVEDLLRSAREESSRQQYGEAISHLREAAEIDPANAEVQELLFSVTARQKEERRQQVQKQTGSEIHEPLDREDFGSTEEHVTRVFETLHGDELLRLKSEVEGKKRDVEKSSGDAQVREQADTASKTEQPDKALRDAARDEAHELLQTATLTRVIDRSEALASGKSDGEKTSFVEKALRKQDETEGQDSLTAQLTEVLPKAPGEVPSSPQEQSRAVRAKEDAVGQEALSRQEAEIRAAVEQAVAACDKAIAKGELSQCMRPLNDLAKQYGATPALATAIGACESKRGHKATQVVLDALQSAQRQLENNSAKKADEALKRVEYALPFGGAVVHSEWQRLKDECAAALNAKRRPKSSASAKHGKTRWYVAGSAIIVAVLAVVGLSHRRHEAPAPKKAVAEDAPAPAPAPAVVQTDMEINASPWAKVVSVQDETGHSITLPDGDQTTPLRLDGVNSGTYKVTLTGSDGKQQTVECNVSAGDHLCAADMGSPDIDQVLKGEQP